MSQNVVNSYRYVAPAGEECAQTDGDEMYKFCTGDGSCGGYGARIGAELRLADAGDTYWHCIDNVLNSVTFWMDHVGSPTGTVYCRVWRDGTTDPLITMGSIDVTTLPPEGSPAEITFNTPVAGSASVPYTLLDNDIIACEFTSGDNSNHPRLLADNKSITGVERSSFLAGGSSWNISNTKSCYIKTQ